MKNKKKKNILVFSTAYYPFVGGAEVAIKEITNNLESKFEFDLITARLDKNLPKIEKIGEITVYRIGFGKPLLDKLLLPFWGASVAWRLEKTRQYFCMWGVMVTFATGAGYIFNSIRRFKGKPKIPMVLTLQEGDSEAHLRYRWGGLIALSWRLALWQTDFLTAISNFLLKRGEKNGYKGRNALIPNGVHVALFSQKISRSTQEKLKAALEKTPEDIFLVTTSRLVQKNATDDIISALLYLPKHVHLVVIGRGEHGPRLQKQVIDLGLSGRVKFVGFTTYVEIPAYLSVCDIFVRPSRSEGFGNSFIEAMAAGIPVIATPVGGIPDFIDDKKTGVFCSPDNPKSIAEAVKLLIGDQHLRKTIVAEARERVIKNYDWKYIASQMKAKVFEKLG